MIMFIGWLKYVLLSEKIVYKISRDSANIIIHVKKSFFFINCLDIMYARTLNGMQYL